MTSGAASRTAPIFQLGRCLAIPMQLHVANRQRLCNRIRDKISSLDTGKSFVHNLSGVFVVLQGGTNTFLGDSDAANVFRQVGPFHMIVKNACIGFVSEIFIFIILHISSNFGHRVIRMFFLLRTQSFLHQWELTIQLHLLPHDVFIVAKLTITKDCTCT